MKYYEVNTINRRGEVMISESFLSYEEAFCFYKSLHVEEMKEILFYENGEMESIVCNYEY